MTNVAFADLQEACKDARTLFTGIDEALEYFDEHLTKKGKPVPYNVLFTYVAHLEEKGEIRIQPSCEKTFSAGASAI